MEGTTTPGIFRISGQKTTVDALYSWYSNLCIEDQHDQKVLRTLGNGALPKNLQVNPHDVASLLKRFIGGLHGGLLGSVELFKTLYGALTNLERQPGQSEETFTAIKSQIIALLISSIPNAKQMHLICAFFGLTAAIGDETKKIKSRRTTDESSKELMGHRALGVVFGPLLLSDLEKDLDIGLDRFNADRPCPQTSMWSKKEKRRSQVIDPKLQQDIRHRQALLRVTAATDLAYELLTHWKSAIIELRKIERKRRYEHLNRRSPEGSLYTFSEALSTDFSGTTTADGTPPTAPTTPPAKSHLDQARSARLQKVVDAFRRSSKTDVAQQSTEQGFLEIVKKQQEEVHVQPRMRYKIPSARSSILESRAAGAVEGTDADAGTDTDDRININDGLEADRSSKAGNNPRVSIGKIIQHHDRKESNHSVHFSGPSQSLKGPASEGNHGEEQQSPRSSSKRPLQNSPSRHKHTFSSFRNKYLEATESDERKVSASTIDDSDNCTSPKPSVSSSSAKPNDQSTNTGFVRSGFTPPISEGFPSKRMGSPSSSTFPEAKTPPSTVIPRRLETAPTTAAKESTVAEATSQPNQSPSHPLRPSRRVSSSIEEAIAHLYYGTKDTKSTTPDQQKPKYRLNVFSRGSSSQVTTSAKSPEPTTVADRGQKRSPSKPIVAPLHAPGEIIPQAERPRSSSFQKVKDRWVSWASSSGGSGSSASFGNSGSEKYRGFSPVEGVREINLQALYEGDEKKEVEAMAGKKRERPHSFAGSVKILAERYQGGVAEAVEKEVKTPFMEGRGLEVRRKPLPATPRPRRGNGVGDVEIRNPMTGMQHPSTNARQSSRSISPPKETKIPQPSSLTSRQPRSTTSKNSRYSNSTPTTPTPRQKTSHRKSLFGVFGGTSRNNLDLDLGTRGQQRDPSPMMRKVIPESAINLQRIMSSSPVASMLSSVAPGGREKASMDVARDPLPSIKKLDTTTFTTPPPKKKNKRPSSVESPQGSPQRGRQTSSEYSTRGSINLWKKSGVGVVSVRDYDQVLVQPQRTLASMPPTRVPKKWVDEDLHDGRREESKETAEESKQDAPRKSMSTDALHRMAEDLHSLPFPSPGGENDDEQQLYRPQHRFKGFMGSSKVRHPSSSVQAWHQQSGITTTVVPGRSTPPPISSSSRGGNQRKKERQGLLLSSSSSSLPREDQVTNSTPTPMPTPITPRESLDTRSSSLDERSRMERRDAKAFRESLLTTKEMMGERGMMGREDSDSSFCRQPTTTTTTTTNAVNDGEDTDGRRVEMLANDTFEELERDKTPATPRMEMAMEIRMRTTPPPPPSSENRKEWMGRSGGGHRRKDLTNSATKSGKKKASRKSEAPVGSASRDSPVHTPQEKKSSGVGVGGAGGGERERERVRTKGGRGSRIFFGHSRASADGGKRGGGRGGGDKVDDGKDGKKEEDEDEEKKAMLRRMRELGYLP